MRQIFVLAVLACVFILAGCGSAAENKEISDNQTAVTAETDSETTSNDSIKEEVTSEPSTDETEKAAEVKEAVAVKEAEAVKETEAAKETTEVKETAVKTETKAQQKESKQTKGVQKATEANKETNEAVVGSIMSKAETKAPAAKTADKADVEKAVTEIRVLVKDLKQKAEAGSTEEVKTIAGQIIKAWDAVKSDIKTADAESHTFLDEKMTKLAEQTGMADIDLEVVMQTDYQIYQGFRQLTEKLGIE